MSTGHRNTPDDAFHSSRLCIVGVGLIGGSLARALKRAGACSEVVGSSRNPEHLRHAHELGVLDRYETDPVEAAQGADMLVLAVPLGATESVLRQLAPVLAKDAVITDVGSAKGKVVASARRILGQRFSRFVGGHPIAGTEHSGVDASIADLFVDHYVVLTPVAETDRDALQRVRAMWHCTGAHVVEMGIDRHDEILAATSHLPHMLAFNLVALLAGLHDREEIFRFAAGGFRDFTRIASSSPVMWHDICLANSKALIPMLEQFDCDLRQLIDALYAGDGDYIMRVFGRAKEARDSLIAELPPAAGKKKNPLTKNRSGRHLP